MILADLLTAAVPAPVTCLGVRLRPLSIGSLLLLFRFNNRFAIAPRSDAAFLPLGDLLQAVIVCSLPWEEAQAALSSPDLASDLRAWHRKLRGHRWQFAQRLSFDARVQAAKIIFADYFAAGSAHPCTKAECGAERDIRSPWPMLTLTGLMEDLHIDFRTAINLPLAFARWLVASNGERKALLEICERGEVANLQAEADQIAREELGADYTPINRFN